MLLHRISDTALTQAKPVQVALCLDHYLSPDSVRHAVELCTASGAVLLLLALRPHNVAVSRLEPHLDALTRAGVKWEIAALTGDPEVAVPELLHHRPEITTLVCDSRSSVAQSWAAHRTSDERAPVTLQVIVVPERRSARPAAGSDDRTVSWLEPRFHRGF